LKLAIVVGTRPEIIKMAPIIQILRRREIDFSYVLTGQHYDFELSTQFLKELGLPHPASTLMLKNSSPASQIAEIMTHLDPILSELESTLLLIQGDTNSMLAAALTGVKLGLQVAHVEAGLRSYDWRMPEEHNRRMVDHVSDILFAPTPVSAKNLTDEKVHGKVFVTGNTVIDAVQLYSTESCCSDIMRRIPFSEFCFATLHRQENVDEPKVLRQLVAVLTEMSIPVVMPLHPRTNRRLHDFGLHEKLTSSPRVCLLPPLGYFDTLLLMRNSKFILTDSGGLQEEATAPSIRKRVVLMRSSTERPEAVDSGFVRVAGVDKENVLLTINRVIGSSGHELPHTSPYGDGRAAERIVDLILSERGSRVPKG